MEMKTKLIRKAYKLEIKPNGEQLRKLKMMCGCARFVYNRALALSIEQYEQDKTTKFSYSKLANLLPEWKKEFVWLKDGNAQSLQQSIKDLESSYKRFFNKISKFPKFKKKGDKDSLRIPQNIKIDQAKKKVFVPKVGWVKYRPNQELIGLPKNMTVTLDGDKTFVSIQVEIEVEDKPHPNLEDHIGIDLGITRFATLSTGDYFNPINAFKKGQKRLKSLQQRLKNKIKGSNNMKKLRLRIKRAHRKIANVRKDYLHKLSFFLSEKYGTISMENLKVSNMSTSAKGTVEEHGRNVKAKSGLNRSILDQGWYMFRSFLEYKLDWKGGRLLLVDPKNTSRKCPCCGHTSGENRQTQSKFECMECGYENNADVVGAINVLARGQEQII